MRLVGVDPFAGLRPYFARVVPHEFSHGLIYCMRLAKIKATKVPPVFIMRLHDKDHFGISASFAKELTPDPDWEYLQAIAGALGGWAYSQRILGNKSFEAVEALIDGHASFAELVATAFREASHSDVESLIKLGRPVPEHLFDKAKLVARTAAKLYDTNQELVLQIYDHVNSDGGCWFTPNELLDLMANGTTFELRAVKMKEAA